jgi:probable F420-dependent oxidoreductase
MKFALYGLHRGSSVEPTTLRARARRAEDAGFESLWVGDHIALPSTAPDPATEPRLEALTTLTFLAAATRRVRLGVGVLVVPQRQPVLLAKQLTSLDALSGGRLTVGIGVGYVDEELRAFGVSSADRGAMTDEFLEAMHALWSGTPTRFDGRWVSFAGVVQAPRPIQRPCPPIVVGGHAKAALRRAARVGAGWFGWDLDVDATRDAVQALRTECALVGRPPEDLEVTIAPAIPLSVETALAYQRQGVHRLVLMPRSYIGAEIDELIDAAGQLIERVP